MTKYPSKATVSKKNSIQAFYSFAINLSDHNTARSDIADRRQHRSVLPLPRQGFDAVKPRERDEPLGLGRGQAGDEIHCLAKRVIHGFLGQRAAVINFVIRHHPHRAELIAVQWQLGCRGHVTIPPHP